MTRMPWKRAMLASTAVVAVVAGLLGGAAGASEPESSVAPAIQPEQILEVQSGESDEASAPTEIQYAQGIIVSRPKGATLREVRRSVRRIMRDVLPDRRIVATVRPSRGTIAYLFDSNISADEAEQLADAIMEAGVSPWAEGDLLIPRDERIQMTEVIPATGTPRPAAADDTNITDPDFLTKQWYLRTQTESQTITAAGFTEAWKTTVGDDSVVVAVLDTGITSHPDLDGQLVPGFDFIHDPVKSLDGDGWDDNPRDEGNWVSLDDSNTVGGPFYGCTSNLPPRSPLVKSSNWHGTHVAGIIAAAHNNYGIVGAAPGVKIQPIRVLGKCYGSVSAIVSGIQWAAGIEVPQAPRNRNPAKVINMSLGGNNRCTPSYQNAINAAVNRGVIIVASVGNDDKVGFRRPANCQNVVRVVSVDEQGGRATYSNFGAARTPSGDEDRLDAIAATGGQGYSPPTGNRWKIYSTVDTGDRGPQGPGFAYYQGTSMAAPLVSAAAALLLSDPNNGASTPTQVKDRLEAKAKLFVTLPAAYAEWQCGFDTCGVGYLNVDSIFPAPGLPQSPTPSIKGSWRKTSRGLAIAEFAWAVPASDSQILRYEIKVSRALSGPNDRWQDLQLSSSVPRVNLRLGMGKTYTVEFTTVSRAGASSVARQTIMVPRVR